MKATCLAMILLVSSAIDDAFAAPEETPLPTIEEVRQHLNDWRKDLVAFRIRYETTYRDTNYRTVRDFVLTDSHDYIDTEEVWAPPKTPTKQVRSGNGSMRCDVRYILPEGGGEWQLASAMKEPRKTSRVGSSYIVTPLYILLDVQSGRWMDDEFFSDEDVSVGGREAVDGENCILLNVVHKRDGAVWGNGTTIWLAVDKGHLIKKIAPNDGPLIGQRDAHYLCTEYQKHDRRWCPHKGRIGVDGTRWEVIEFQDKPTITPETFLPPPKEALVSANPQQSQKPPTSTSGTAFPLPSAVPGWSLGSTLSPLLLVIGGIGLFCWWKAKDSQ